MKSVSIIIVLCTIPAGLGVIIDRFLLNRHKGRLHNALLRYWVHLDELSIPGIRRVFADYALRFFKRVFGKRFFSLRCIITLILVSFCLTVCAIFLGYVLDTNYNISDIVSETTWWIVIIYLLTNLVFDTATGMVTAKVLSVIQKSTLFKAVILIIIDIILALLFAIACVFILGFIIGQNIDSTIYALHRLFQTILGNEDSMNIAGILYAGTTFIPTLIYFTILVTLMISKAILGIVIRFTKYFFEVATEVKESKDLKVFTLTGSFFSVTVILLTGFMELRKALY